jgi:hypothetical protein
MLCLPSIPSSADISKGETLCGLLSTYHERATITASRVSTRECPCMMQPAIEILTFAKVPYSIPGTVRLLRGYGKLLLDPRRIINSVQNSVLPLDVIHHPKDGHHSRTGIECSERRNCRLLPMTGRRPFNSGLSDQPYRLPGERARGDGESFGALEGGVLSASACTRPTSRTSTCRGGARITGSYPGTG